MITEVGKARVGLYSISLSHPPVHHIMYHHRIDVSKWRDPMGQKTLRSRTGLDLDVQAYLSLDPRMGTLRDTVRLIAAEDRPWTAIALYDYHGRHISAGLVELLGKDLDQAGKIVSITHLGWPQKTATVTL